MIARARIGWSVARIWPGGGGRLERQLKNWKKGAVLCPVCWAPMCAGRVPEVGVAAA